MSLLLFTAASKSENRIQVFLRLQNGQTLRYDNHARVNRYVRTKSNVATVLQPTPLQAEVSAMLELSVHDFHDLDHRPMLAAETHFVVPLPQPASPDPSPPPIGKVSFSIGGDGAVTQADGLDDLDAVQRLVWQFWVAQFAFGWTLPPSGVKSREKWKSEEIERTPSPIANLVWERETVYVQDDACPIVRSEQCAFFLVTSNLKQKSNPDDTTPEDYRLHQLKTSGTATGSNEDFLYISRKTGLLMRASEDLQQRLDVTIAKSDGTNQVHYDVTVTSHFETLFVPQTAPPS